MCGPPTLGSWSEQIAQPDIRKRSAHHHLVITPPRAVRVEILRQHAMCNQISAGGAIRRNRAGGRNMNGGDAIAQNGERPQSAKVVERRGLERHVFEIWRILNVGGMRVPRVKIACWNR